MDDRLESRLRDALRGAGRRVEEIRDAYREGRRAADLPTDEEGRVRIVCRRHAERRAVALDDATRPACYEDGHPDCEGCVEDVREGVVETW
jgi:hypothetical protein